MKRKAMLMGMAVMASMPGWATAKGAGKTVGGGQHYSDALEARESLETVEVIKDVPGAGSASGLLAQIKDVLRRADYGTVIKPRPDGAGWTMELMPQPDMAPGYGDARTRPAAPLGVAFRFRF